MGNNKRLHKKEQQRIALQRIRQLFTLAIRKALQGDLKLADRYIHLARKLSMKYLVPIPAEYKRLFCKQCYCFLLAGVTGSTRLHRGKIVWHCCKCGHYTRMPLHGKKPKKTSS